jgi:hypothetical protein
MGVGYTRLHTVQWHECAQQTIGHFMLRLVAGRRKASLAQPIVGRRPAPARCLLIGLVANCKARGVRVEDGADVTEVVGDLDADAPEPAKNV